MRRPLIIANWKMNGSRAMTRELGAAIAAGSGEFATLDIGICPPHVLLATLAEVVQGSAVALGAQDVSEYESGAYTGEVAAAMLRDYGCRYAIVGHSERRQLFGDTSERVAAKLATACANGLVPILCVGETIDERRANRTEEVITAQLKPVFALPGAAALVGASVIAYEPVWAIGSGETATPEQAATVHACIRARLAAVDGQAAERVRILYGGSVKPDNAAALFASPDVDGGLVGGASLDAASFLAICAAAG